MSLMSDEREAAQNGSPQEYKNPSPEPQETPKLLPTLLPSPEMPSHRTNLSTSSKESDVSMGSALSDLSSISTSSTESITVTISGDVQKDMVEIIQDKDRYPTAGLRRLADRHLEILEHTPRNNRLISTPRSIVEKVDAYKIIWAMWDYVKDRTGDRYERPIRYTAAAIVTCGDDIQRFVALANTWFGLFLWPFRAQSHYDKGTQSEAATPTVDETASAFRDPGSNKPKNRDEKMAEEVLRRDNFTCVVSGMQFEKAHNYDAKRGVACVQCAHIFKRSVAGFSTSDNHNAMATLDIVRNYCPQMAWSLSLLDGKFDSPSNGIALEPNTHIFFDKYKFCLIPVEGKTDTYKFRTFTELPQGIPLPRNDEEITFKDNSHWHTTDAPAREHTMEIRPQAAGPAPQSILPDPWFLSIHAAVAHVLHASGAAEYIDSFLRHDNVGPGSSAEMKKLPDVELRHMKLDLEHGLSRGNPIAF